jgi:anti-sigma factor RsiW
MSSCRAVDALVTPYIDGSIPEADRRAVDEHLRACPPCHSRVASERAARNAIRTCRGALAEELAPAALRERCLAHAHSHQSPVASHQAPGASRRSWRSRIVPFALAASLLLVFASAFLYQLTAGSTRVLAAELTADHVKCFTLNAVLGTHDLPSAVEGTMASSFGWNMHLPSNPASVGLELVGARPCLYGEGKIAHIMYRQSGQGGQPVSLFMLPKDARAPALISVLGHQAMVWCVGDRTFVMIARERQQVERLAEWMQASVR